LLCALKPLEERAVPAILFTPQFGQETVHDNGGAKLSKEAVFLAFMGTYWTSGNAYPTANQIISATQSFLASTYMANLGQYGNGLGNAYYAGSAFDSTNSKNHFSYGDLNDEVNHLVDSGELPRPASVNGTPLYLVVTPPGITSDEADAGGYHTLGYDFNLSTGFELHVMGWIGDEQSLDADTSIISHEIVEADTDPYLDTGIRAFPGATWTQGGADELCDAEATDFTARLNGALVQSYWSRADQAFITGGEVQGFFVRNRVLFVHGDQLATTLNDSITLKIVGSDEVVQENGESAVIPLRELDAVVVQEGQGTDTIDVEGTAYGVPVTIAPGTGADTINIDGTSYAGPVTVNGGNGADVVNVDGTSYGGPVTINLGFGPGTVNVAPTSKNLNDIQGTVTVSGGPNTDVLNLDDQSDAVNETFTMTGSSVSGFGAGSVNFQGINSVILNGGSGNTVYNVQNTEGAYPTTINTGRAGSMVNVLATSGPLQINGGPAYPNRDSVKIGNAGLMQSIFGIVTITNPSSVTDVTVDDSADPTVRNLILNTDTTHGAPYGKLTGLSPAAIEFRYLNAVGLTAQTTFKVDTGANDVVNVQATGVATTIISNGSGTVNVGNAGSVQGIVGPLIITDPTGLNNLNVDDSADATARTATLRRDIARGPAFGQVAGLAPATIDFNNSQIRGLILQTGANATVNVLSSGAPITVTGHGPSAVNVGNGGTVQGIAFPVVVTNANVQTAVTIDDSADPTARTVTLDTLTLAGNIVYGRVTGLAPAPVLYRQGQVQSPVTIDGGAGGNTFNIFQTIQTATLLNAGAGTNTINIQATRGELEIETGQSFPNSTVNIGSEAPALGGNLAGILGTVVLLNTNNFTLLNVDDSGDATARAGLITRTAITGLSPAAILTNHNTNGMTILGGSGGNVFMIGGTDVATTLDSGTGNDTVYYQGSTSGNFVLDGQAGNDGVILGSSTPTGKTLAGFGAPVSIDNSTGSTSLVVDDSADTTASTVTLSSRGLTGFGTAGIGLGSGVTNLLVLGGSGGNNFTVAGTIAGTTNLHTGSGDDTVTLQATGGPLGVAGDSGTNTLLGPNTASTWNILNTNDGSVGNVSFSSFANLTGGPAPDVFAFANGSSITGTIDGGGGGDWLDYSLMTTPVTVNLATGSATAAGSIVDVQNVRGGSGGDTLAGNSQGNILIGGSGNDVIMGGSGRSVLIGNQGVDTILGGSADDIIIGGSTAYDPSGLANDLALEAILAEWQSTSDTYAIRVAQIRAGTGVDPLAFGLTVFDDSAANVFAGADGTDWFFLGSDDVITDRTADEQIN
jgi:hypothetical protein